MQGGTEPDEGVTLIVPGADHSSSFSADSGLSLCVEPGQKRTHQQGDSPGPGKKGPN